MPRKPKVLSLDQCYLRFLLRPPAAYAQAFRHLKEALTKAVEAEKVVCPAHVEETIYESVLLPPSDRDGIIELQITLSRGVGFESFFHILAAETLRLARPSFKVDPYRIGVIRFRDGANLPALAERLRHARVTATATGTQMQYPPPSYQPGADLKDIFRWLSEERAGALFQIVKSIETQGRIDTGRQEWDGAVAVGELLISETVTSAECATLAEAILSHDWEKIPVYFYHTFLFAKIERDEIETGRRFTMNDHPDVLRVSVALEYADAIACDKYIKENIRQSGLEKELPVRVFSPKEPDQLAAWIERL